MGGGCRALIVSPPTIDIIALDGSTVVRPGGPGLYAGYALKHAGCEVSLLGPAGSETLMTARVERELGLERIGYMTPLAGFIFRLEYKGGKRRVSFSGDRSAVDPQILRSALRREDPDLLVLSPIFGELSPSDAVAACVEISHCAVDAQGFVRGGLEVPSGVPLLHASDDDISYDEVRKHRAKVIYYTRGDGPVSVIVDGKEFLIAGPGERLEDPTGAGDVFTALVAHFTKEGEDPSSAAIRAMGETVKVLEALRGLIGLGREFDQIIGQQR